MFVEASKNLVVCGLRKVIKIQKNSSIHPCLKERGIITTPKMVVGDTKIVL